MRACSSVNALATLATSTGSRIRHRRRGSFGRSAPAAGFDSLARRRLDGETLDGVETARFEALVGRSAGDEGLFSRKRADQGERERSRICAPLSVATRRPRTSSAP